MCILCLQGPLLMDQPVSALAWQLQLAHSLPLLQVGTSNCYFSCSDAAGIMSSFGMLFESFWHFSGVGAMTKMRQPHDSHPFHANIKQIPSLHTSQPVQSAPAPQLHVAQCPPAESTFFATRLVVETTWLFGSLHATPALLRGTGDRSAPWARLKSSQKVQNLMQ